MRIDIQEDAVSLISQGLRKERRLWPRISLMVRDEVIKTCHRVSLALYGRRSNDRDL